MLWERKLMSFNMPNNNSIVIFTIDSLYSVIILNQILPVLRNKVALIVLSDRYKGKHGSFFKQFRKNLSRSGWSFVLYLNLIFVLHNFFIFFHNIYFKFSKTIPNFLTISYLTRKFNIPVIKIADINSHRSEKILREINPDIIISCYFDQLIKRNIYEIPKIETINFHSGSLPTYRGPFPPFWALLHGQKKFSIHAHVVEEKFDRGPTLAKCDYSPTKITSLLQLECELYREMGKFILEFLSNFNQNNKLTVHDDGTEGYYGFPSKKDIIEMKKMGIPLYNINDFLKELF